jgi:UDP:flavonoid glycosyltransferase YjiC (YdhE family)
MARVLFLTWDGAGNQPPAAALAAALERQGHAVVFAGNEHQRRYFAERGFDFVLLGRAASRWRQDAPERMFAIKREAVWACSDHIDDVPQLMARHECDAVIVDCLMFGALAAAERLQLRAAAFIHSAPGALMPPGGPFEAQLIAQVNRLREKAGLNGLISLWEAWAPFPAISNSIRALDRLASQAPKSFQYCGPMHEHRATPKWICPWPSTDDRPLVLVSFSTGPYWDQSSRILMSLEALADRPYRVLVTAGQARVEARQVPANAVIVERAPHEAILPSTALTITHAGHGTVLASLSHGVPLLCLPNPVADQPILARQVEALGSGLSFEGDSATPAAIGAAADRMLCDRSYAAKARLLAEEIAQSPGAAFAVSHLESALGLSTTDAAAGSS